jgi:glycosyltransferase involved in cell wall biosynthesis
MSESRVCFLGSHSYPCPLDSTSEKKFRELTKLGEIFVIGSSADAKPHRFREHANFYLIPYPKIRFVRYPLRVVAGFMLVLWCVLGLRATFIVAQSPFDGFAGTLVKAVVRFRKKRLILIVENHGDFELSPLLQDSRSIPGFYQSLLQRVAVIGIKNSDLLRAVSTSTRLQLAEKSEGKRIFQFPTWTDIDAFLEIGASNKARRPPSIIFAGNLIPRKGVIHLINAFDRIASDFPAVRLEIAGPIGDLGHARHLRERLNELNLGRRIQLTGPVPQTELALRMRRARVFVLPTYSEGLPRVLFEAMAVGLPSIASAVGGIPDILENGETGFLIEPGDEDALERHLRWILDHPQEADEMGRRAREFAASFFSTEQYLEGYRQMLEAGRSLIG